ncbi:MAG: hypothetical protein JWM05_150, partial [Acidimicrobiales bacterium]|nr:hypothetical protein [Acidimicrobiales bacterium]
HHLTHEGGYTLKRTPDGTLEFRRPNGAPIHTPRPNHLPLRITALPRAGPHRRQPKPAPVRAT